MWYTLIKWRSSSQKGVAWHTPNKWKADSTRSREGGGAYTNYNGRLTATHYNTAYGMRYIRPDTFTHSRALSAAAPYSRARHLTRHGHLPTCTQPSPLKYDTNLSYSMRSSCRHLPSPSILTASSPSPLPRRHLPRRHLHIHLHARASSHSTENNFSENR